MESHEGMTEALLDLTIIVANYNTRDLLRGCLESVYRFTDGISFEVICVDDNSPDGSADMVEALFPNVILIRNTERLLYAKNHNLGMRMSRARYACHLDSDTLLTSNAFAAMVRFMDEHPEVAACGPRLLNADGSVQHCIRGFAGAGTFLLQALYWHRLFPDSRVMNRYYRTDFDYSRAQSVESIGTSAYVLRRSTWEQVGMFDERFGQFMVDLSYNFTLNQRGCSIYYTPCAKDQLRTRVVGVAGRWRCDRVGSPDLPRSRRAGGLLPIRPPQTRANDAPEMHKGPSGQPPDRAFLKQTPRTLRRCFPVAQLFQR
jgi:GT2 family glycosyltransferase